MFGGAEQELYMENAIHERRTFLEDREDSFRRQLGRMAREGQGEHRRTQAAVGWLGTAARTVWAALWTTRNRSAADTAA